MVKLGNWLMKLFMKYIPNVEKNARVLMYHLHYLHFMYRRMAVIFDCDTFWRPFYCFLMCDV